MSDVDWSVEAVAALRATGIDLAVGLPDSGVAPLFEATEAAPDLEALLVSREEEAVGVLGGAWVGGRRGVLLCQTSGLANALNAVGSLSVPARLPFVGLVSRRGALGEFNAAQVPAGYDMPAVLDALGVRNCVVERPGAVAERARLAATSAFSTGMPYVVFLDATVTGHKPEAER
ncbi:MAG: thiamine pyrophosphate-binding protein [Haloferacaceae archaeon]